MYYKVLVPLDGSELAERALPQVRELFREGLIRKVILLSIAELKHALADTPANHLGIGLEFDLPPQLHEKLEIYRNYLAQVESQLRHEGMDVESVVLGGNNPAKSISDFAEENGIHLIVIATHDYRGMKRLLRGSVTAKVLHDSHIPVLLVKPETGLYHKPWVSTENFSEHRLQG